MTSEDGLKWDEDGASWGLDLFSPAPAVTVSLYGGMLTIYDYNEKGENAKSWIESTSSVKNNYFVLNPANRIEPVFEAAETYDVTDKM